VLRQVKKGQKLCTRGAFLDIETPYLVPECIRRWKRQDNRDNMIIVLNRIINNALIIHKTDDSLTVYIDQCVSGLDNLKHTYSMCHQTVARLDMILDKIRKVIPEKDIDFSIKDLENL
jgi:hypothetical protein